MTWKKLRMIEARPTWAVSAQTGDRMSRTVDRTDVQFADDPEWIYRCDGWVPGTFDEVLAICQRLT